MEVTDFKIANSCEMLIQGTYTVLVQPDNCVISFTLRQPKKKNGDSLGIEIPFDTTIKDIEKRLISADFPVYNLQLIKRGKGFSRVRDDIRFYELEMPVTSKVEALMKCIYVPYVQLPSLGYNYMDALKTIKEDGFLFAINNAQDQAVSRAKMLNKRVSEITGIIDRGYAHNSRYSRISNDTTIVSDLSQLPVTFNVAVKFRIID